MTISHIKNPWLRRGTLVVALVPLIILLFVFHVGVLVLELVRDLPGAIGRSWRGQ